MRRWYRRPSRLGVAGLAVLIITSSVFLIYSESRNPQSSPGIRIDYNLQLTVNGVPVAAGGWTASSCPASSRWICSLILNGVVVNDTTVLFPGQTVQVNLWIEYLRKPADPQTVTLRSVSAGEGFQLVKVNGEIPQNLTGWGSQGGITLLLRALQGAQSGKIGVSESFSV